MRRNLGKLVVGLTLVGGCGDDGGDEADSGTGSTAPATSTTTTSGETSTASGTTSGETATSNASGGSGIDTDGLLGCGQPVDGEDDEGVICFYDVDNPDTEPLASIEYQLGSFDGKEALYVRVAFSPVFVDNTYGATQIGWGQGGHTFDELVGSDHAEIRLTDELDSDVLHFQLDYIDDDAGSLSGFKSLGVWGGNGGMVAGDINQILGATSSLSRNLNDRGYPEYIVDSPATDADYTPNGEAPEWDFRVVYEAWIDKAAFPDGPGKACIDFIHASPSKADDNTKEVIPDECPPGWGCYNVDGCDVPDCMDPDGLCDPTTGNPNPP